MLTAEEAKKISDDYKFEMPIVNAIETACVNGLYSVDIKAYGLNTNTRDKLIKFGYKIKDIRDEDSDVISYKITWG